MPLEKMWALAQLTIPQGQHNKLTCINTCGDDRSMIVNNAIDGSMSAYCFRCGKIGYKHAGQLTLADKAHNKKLLQEATAHAKSKRITLPSDTTFDMALWSPEARLWCFKAGIYGQQTDVGYSPKLNRCVLPVYEPKSSSDGNRLIFYQLRKLTGDGPKYISPSIDRSTIMYRRTPTHTSARQTDSICRTVRSPCVSGSGLFKTGKQGTYAIIVEDILSAIRVGTHVPTYSLLGTSLSIENAGRLSKYDHIITWLDGDEGGRKGVLQVRKRMSLTSKVSNIETDLDPKEYSNKQIEEILIEHLQNIS